MGGKNLKAVHLYLILIKQKGTEISHQTMDYRRFAKLLKKKTKSFQTLWSERTKSWKNFITTVTNCRNLLSTLLKRAKEQHFTKINLGIPNLATTSLIKHYWMLQNSWVTVFTISELLRKNQQGWSQHNTLVEIKGLFGWLKIAKLDSFPGHTKLKLLTNFYYF